MINNNPYNIPERPHKARKVIIQTSPLYPHQVNRTHDQQESKNRNFIQKRPSNQPFFMESSRTEISRIPPTPHNVSHMNMSTVSQVSQWNGLQSNYNSPHFQELSEKISAINSRLDNHDKKLAILLEMKRQQTPKNVPLTQSTSLSHETLSAASKQMERYHSTEEPWDRLREEFSSYKSQSEKLGEDLRAQLQEQKDNITQQLIVSFKECLKEKFMEQQVKISEYLSDFEHTQSQKFTEKINELTSNLKDELKSIVRSTNNYSHTQNHPFVSQLKEKLTELTLTLNELQSNYHSFRDEVFDHVLATQDQKRWLYEMEDSILKIKNSISNNGQVVIPGSIGVSRQHCFKQIMQLTYEQYLRVAGQEVSFQAAERNYLIDHDGFLLDSNKFYLVNTLNQKIRLSESQLCILKQKGILK